MQMGIGKLGPTTMINRKFRWTLEGEFPTCQLKPSFVKVQSRPTVNLADADLNAVLNLKEHDPEITLKPIKDKWEPISTTHFDAGTEDTTGLFAVLAAHYVASDKKESIKGTLVLKLIDGLGVMMEEWKLLNAHATRFEFEPVDYTSSEITPVNVTWEYDGVVFKSHDFAPPYTIYDKTSTGTGADSLSPQS